MIEIGFFGLVAVCTLIAISNWRVGLYLAIFVDVARDPIRKLSESHSVLLTVVGTLVWVGVLIGAMNSDGKEIWSVFRRYPRFGMALNCLLLSLIPGVILSLVMYPGGYQLVVIGLISYVGPLVGVAVGFLIPVTEKEIYRVFRFYSLINGVALIGTSLEAMGYTHPVLGGIDMEWIRQQTGLLVELRAGIYRSPDIMGLHAAHVIVFSMMLGLKSRGPVRLGWIAMVLWGCYAVMLSGRRKMIGIPLVFIAGYLGLGMYRGCRNASTLATLTVLGAIAATVLLFVIKTDNPGDNYVDNEYTQYASTMFTQGGDRARDLLTESILVTVYQSGVLGSGIGSATQGSHYVKVKRSHAWQEDGASRLFKELGVPGVILILCFVVMTLQTLFSALRLIPAQHPLALTQIGVLAIVLGNGASFMISHQQYSGDPGSAILVLMMLGMVLGIPRVFFAVQAKRERRREEEQQRQTATDAEQPGPRLMRTT